MTSTDIAVRQGGASDLAIDSDQTFWSDKQIAALRQLGMGNATNGDLAVFFHHATRTGLDPFARQIYMIQRQGKQTIQTGIDGFRLIARRATDRSRGTFGYEDTLWCGEDGQWTDVWLSREHPRAAKVTVVRDGQRYPAVALWDEYVGLKGGGEITSMWQTKGALMLAKCAEALALRRAFPQDLSGLYTADETQHGDPAGEQGPPPAPGAGADRARDILGAEASQEPDAGEAPEGITSAQTRKLGVLMREAGLTDRDDALAYVAGVIDRTVGSRNELTKDEASRVIDALEKQATEKAAAEQPPASGKDEEPVDGQTVEDELWEWIKAAGHERGLTPADLEDDFAARMGGVVASTASASELEHYLQQLTQEPAA